MGIFRFPVTQLSIEDWLNTKKNQDGAEGLWRINDKLYDFTVWSRLHPGGSFWLDKSRGTDITEAFESHHFSEKPEAILQKYYIAEATTPRHYTTTFGNNGFYKTFKKKLYDRKITTSFDNSFWVKSIADFLAVLLFVTLLNRRVWTVAPGIILGILSAYSHNFIHRRPSWRMLYYDLSLMSSRQLKMRHMLSHHFHRNTALDLEVPHWQIFLYPITAHVQFVKRCLDVILSHKLGFDPEELVAFALPLVILMTGVPLWTAFLTWNKIILIGSFVSCLLNSCHKRGQLPSESNHQRENGDFGIKQINIVGTDSNHSLFAYLNSFRSNALHYLCPTVNCENLHKLIPVFEETLKEFGIKHPESSGLLEGVQKRLPEGHVFFS